MLALESAEPILGPCPYIDRLITWRDFQHKGRRGARVEKLGVVAGLALRLRARGYGATLLLHRSSGAMRKLVAMMGSPVRAGASSGGDGYTHPAAPGSGVESSREENSRVLAAIGIEEDGGALELWTKEPDAAWAADLVGRLPGPHVGLHPGSDWSCQQWLPERFAEVGRQLQDAVGASLIITGTQAETGLEAEIAKGLARPPLRACGITSFSQFVEVIRHLDLLICVNSAAAAVARAVGTPAVVLLGFEDARYTGLTNTRRLTVVQPAVTARDGGWCEFGRWGVLSGCNSPICRGLGGLAGVEPSVVAERALALLERAAESGSPARPQSGTAAQGTGTGVPPLGQVPIG